MSKKQNSEQVNPAVDSSSKIEAIKNLIFGENIQQYNSEFETLKKEIDTQKTALENYIYEVRGELMQKDWYIVAMNDEKLDAFLKV